MKMSGKSCIIAFKDTNLSKQLRKRVGTDDARYTEYQLSVVNSNDDTKFTDDFVKWYKDNYKTEPKFDSKNASVLADRVIRYYNKNIITSAKDNIIGSKSINLVNTKNYGNAQDYENGKRYCANIILNISKYLKDNNITIKRNKAKEYYARQLKNQWNKYIFEHIAKLKNKTVKEIEDDYNEAKDKYAYINRAFGEEKTINEQNLLAVYSELNGTNERLNEYIDEVFADQKLNNIRGDIKGEQIDINEANATNSNEDTEGTNKEDESIQDSDQLDMSLTDLNNHIGTYTDWKRHLGPRIAQYFDTLPKLSTPSKKKGEYDLDTNNRFGIADTMDAAQCSNMIYSTASFSNKTTMIDSIRRIGQTVPGFESFTKLADDLEDDKDFATEMFSVFAKTIMKKIETVVNNNKSSVRVSNERASKEAAMIYDGINNLRNIIIDTNSTLLEAERQSVSRRATAQLKNKNTNQKTIDALTDDVIKLVRQLFPNLTYDAIKSYINTNNNASTDKLQILRNINNLTVLIKSTIEEIPNSISAYAAKQSRINEAISINNNIKKDEELGNLHDRSEFVDLNELYKEDFLTQKQQQSVRDIMIAIEPYSVVNVSLNSRNVYGNLSSDVINNSFITRFTKLLDGFYIEYKDDGSSVIRNKNLENWALQRFKSNQYEYSNILLEHKDENGNIINKGLFKKVGDGYQLTEYSPEFLSTFLYNGASNVDDGNNALYNKMTSGDYFPTAFINFFKAEVNGKPNTSYANYFMRIPSDAPKTFVIRGARYSTNNLYTITNAEEVNNNATEIADNYDKINLTEWTAKYKGEIVLPIVKDNRGTTNEQIVKAITNQDDMYISDIKAAKIINEETGEAYVTVGVRNATKENPNAKDDMYVFKGTLVKRGKANFLLNRELVGVVSSDGTRTLKENIRTDVINYYKEQLKDKDVSYKGKVYNKSERKINTEHLLFKVFVNTFKQELLDMAAAMDHYFEFNSDGTIMTKNGKPVFKAGADNKVGYKNYHLGKNGTVVEEVKKGGIKRYKFGGKVFTSNKFTLNTTVDGVVVPINYLNEVFSELRPTEVEDKGLIHLFYGGFSQNGINVVRNNNGKIVDVNLNEAQQEKVNDAIKNFLEEYCRQAITRTNKFSNFIKDINTTTDNIVDFAINNLIMHYSYDDLFEGNTKFYKNSQNILKRAKEVQGSGVPYGISDYNEIDNSEIKEIEDSYLNNGVYKTERVEINPETKDKRIVKVEENIQDILKGTVLDGVKQRTGFKAVTIKNSINTNFSALKELKEVLIDKGLSEDKADNLLYGPIEHDAKGKILYEDKEKTIPKRRGGFTGTKVNDAQSYITFKEWVRRIAGRGQLKRYMPLIKKLIDPNSTITAKDIDEFVQVQKNFYYDIHFDSEFSIHVPRQIKNAEFVLIPKLIKGTQLEKVAEMMDKAGIDQLNTVETNKASNKNILTLWDNDGEISEERYNNFASEAKQAAENYYYNYLYTQQETRQHVNDENKAGIQIVKKIIDNLKKGLDNPNAIKFFSNYIANIEETYNNLLTEFEVPRDENGNIIIDEDGNIKNLDKKVFYSRLEEELLRTGINTNLRDYVTIDPSTGEPITPPISNLILSKFETTVQSIFNNKITRQKLPGFHAAQVTNIGWKRLDYGESKYCLKTNSSIEISAEEYKALPKEEQSKYRNTKIQYDGSLRYHPDKKGYIEVKLPYSALGINKNDSHYKNMTNQEILEELSKDNLDMVIGYRIPTEGKQSICVMKVVDFIDDSLGSTIIVPNDWVSQTGSDFDIDSVYGIQYSTYKTADGQIHRPKHITSENATMVDWFNYIENFAKTKDDTNIGEKISKIVAQIKSENNEIFKKLRKLEDDSFKNLIINFGNAAKSLVSQFKRIVDIIDSANPDATPREKYILQLNAYNKLANVLLSKKINKKQEDAVKEYINTVNNLSEFLEGQTENIKKDKDDAISKIYTEKIDKYNEIAREAGLLTFDEFFDALDAADESTLDGSSNIAKINTKEDRNNSILDSMISILMNTENLEENLSRSNFDKISEALHNVLSNNFKTERENRSPYNVFDEVEYQEEAMSGAALKAFSVTLDTFCSVCNVVKPTLTDSVKVIYNTKEYDKTDIDKRYKTNKLPKNKFSVIHNQYGWSTDNRNIEGMILTSYSSQTTAYILDAIKEGAIPNVNQYTFSTFKTLVNLGIDYNTAIAFITSPAISRIANNNMNFNSIYSDVKGNPIEESIRQIAKELGLSSDPKTPVTAILSSIQSKYSNTINKIFKIDNNEIKFSLSKKDSANIAIDVAKLKDRINETGEFSNKTPVEERLIFDLGNILIFNRLHSVANSIGDIARCCNPDRFGAKQTVFATDEVFNNIQSILFDEDSGVKKFKENILEVDGKNILQAIYPNCEEGVRGILKSDVRKSAYPSLAAFLKYASATSSIISKQVLLTQHPQFASLCRGLNSVFSGLDVNIDEATYKDFQSYALTYLYNQVPVISKSIKFILNKNNTYTKKIDGESNSLAESQRIYGYNVPASLDVVERKTVENTDGTTRTKTIIKPFSVENANYPTQEEIDKFATYSPAQKVEWIKRNFTEPGIFGFLNVELYNGANRGWRQGMQTIEFVEDSINQNVAFDLFYAAYYNENPLVSMAALDLIKYAVQVEGLKMQQKGISKIIDNQPLIDDVSDGGTGFFNYVKEQFGILNSTGSQFYSEENKNQLYERYLRSHPNSVKLRSFRLNSYNIRKYNIETRSYDIININKPNDKKKTDEENRKAFNENLKRLSVRTYHPLTSTYSNNKYVRVYRDNKTVIYKIKDLGDQIILYPLNALNTNEVSDYSSNISNNSYPHPTAFEAIINEYAKVKADKQFTSQWIKDLVSAKKEEDKDFLRRYKAPRNYSNIANSKDFNIDVEAEKGGGMSILKDTIEKHFNGDNVNDLYIRSNALGNYIFNQGPAYGVQQVVTFKNGVKKSFIICKVNNRKMDKFYLSGDKTENQTKIDAIKNDTLREVYTRANEQGLKTISDLYTVIVDVASDSTAQINGSLQSTLEESNYSVTEFARLQGSKGDKLSLSMTNKFKINGVNNTKSSIADNKEFATREITSYVVNKVKQIKHNFDYFIEDPTDPDNKISILDPAIQDIVSKNDAYLNRYMKLTNEAGALLRTLNIYNDLITDNESAEIDLNLKKIKQSIDTLRSLPIDEAERALARGWATKISTNPLIKANILDILDGYYKTYGSMWRFHDIAENGNPLLQTILLDVSGDIEAKRMMTIRTKSNYRKNIRRIIDNARKAGKTVDIHKIINDNTDTFNLSIDESGLRKLDELTEAKREAAARFGQGSIEHLRAKNKYDLFIANHFNQKAKPEYYINKANNERIMIEQYPELYSEYMKLYYRRNDLYRSNSERGMTDEARKELDAINKTIYNLTRPGVYIDESGNYVQRPVIEEGVTYSEDTKRILNLYSNTAQQVLSSFIKANRDLRNKYFTYDPVYGFEENLKNNLNIISSFERRDANGIPTVPANILESNPKYVAARNWIRENARFVFVEDEGEDSFYTKIKGALNKLALGKNAKRAAINDYLRERNDGNGIRDEHGIFDGTKLSEEEILEVKKRAEDGYNVKDMPVGSDRILINSTGRDRTFIYDSSFYKGMSSGKVDNPQYLKIVGSINRILEKYYSEIDGVVHLDRIPDTEEGIKELNELAILYQELRATKKSDMTDPSVKDFIKENVEFVTDKEVYLSQLNAANEKSSDYKEAWLRVNLERDSNGNIIIKQDGKSIPNRFLYSYAKPKGKPGDKKYDRFVNDNVKQRNEDLNLISSVYRSVPTKYYYQAMTEALRKSQEDKDFSYSQWYQNNHVYNPYTRKYEPLPCWTMNEVRSEEFADREYIGQWVPNFAQRENKVIDGKEKIIVNGEEIETYDKDKDMRNPNWKENLSLADNYVKGSQKGEYDNKVELNEYEIQMRDYLKDLLYDLSYLDSAKRFFERGNLPIEAAASEMNAKGIAKELSKIVGFNISTNNGKEDYYNELGYEIDKTPLMPFTKLLKSKQISRATTIEEAEDYLSTNNTIDFQVQRPSRTEELNGIELQEAIGRYDEINKKVREHNAEISKGLRNKDWYDVIEHFIDAAGHYNAVQENKEKLYYLLSMLQKQRHYMRKYGLMGDLKKDDRRVTEDNRVVYEQSVDKDLLEQYQTYMRRLLFDQWKQPEGKMTRWANNIQGFVSANYMMLNIRGGLANVNLGETAILGEAAAGEEFSKSDWGFGTAQWIIGAIGFAQGIYSDKAVNKQDAIIKFFKAVDYDEVTGRVKQADLAEWTKRIRDFGYSPQSTGEHFMQNSVLFAMMHSHKIIPVINDPRGIGFTIMNKEEYIANGIANNLGEILTEEQLTELNDSITKLKEDANKLKDYAWYRKDPVSEYVALHCDKEQVNKYYELRKKLRKELSDKFDERQSIYDQVELGEDGYMTFVKDSDLAKLDEQPYNNITQALDLLGRFSERVRKTNNKIHGVYNRLGAADIEKTWWGGLVMQYHKHLPMGILKRYKAKGFYSEFRGTKEKGMVQSVFDVLSLNARRIHREGMITQEESNALEAFQNTIKDIIPFILELPTTWKIATDYDKANIRRNLGDAVGTLGAFFANVALYAIGQHDDEGVVYNLAVYEMDRLGSEAFMYNPIGATTEVKKLMSTPIAAQSIVTDVMQSIYQLSNIVLLGDEYDGIYHSGRFAGESKLGVYIQRRIPIWNGIRNIIDIEENNKFYKVGTTGSTIFNYQSTYEWLDKTFK